MEKLPFIRLCFFYEIREKNKKSNLDLSQILYLNISCFYFIKHCFDDDDEKEKL